MAVPGVDADVEACGCQATEAVLTAVATSWPCLWLAVDGGKASEIIFALAMTEAGYKGGRVEREVATARWRRRVEATRRRSRTAFIVL